MIKCPQFKLVVKYGKKTFCFLLFICMGVCACTVRHNSLRSTLCAEIVANVRDSVLPFWMDYAVAPDGGFYGTVLRNGTPVVDAPRGGVLNARILWSFLLHTVHLEMNLI